MERIIRKLLVVKDSLPDRDSEVRAVVCYPFGLWKGALSAHSKAVLDTARQLADDFLVYNVIVMGGWKTPGMEGDTEGELGYTYLKGKGKMPQATTLRYEKLTDDTWQQGDYLCKIYPELKGESDRVIVVAQQLHLRRCELVTRRRLPDTVKVYRKNACGAGWCNDKWALAHPIRFGLREIPAYWVTKLLHL